MMDIINATETTTAETDDTEQWNLWVIAKETLRITRTLQYFVVNKIIQKRPHSQFFGKISRWEHNKTIWIQEYNKLSDINKNHKQLTINHSKWRHIYTYYSKWYQH